MAKIREQPNYGGHIFSSNFELMYFKKTKTSIEYQFNLYLDVSLFEQDEKYLPIGELARQTISGTNFDVFVNDNKDLLAAVETHLRTTPILKISSSYEILDYEVDGQNLVIQANISQINGTLSENKRKSDYNGGFTQVIQASGELMQGIYVALLEYSADRSNVFKQAKKVILGE